MGDGKVIKEGQKLTVYYVTQSYDTTTVIDSAISHDGFQFVFGSNTVIKGWNIGLKGIRIGGKRKMIIPPQLAYNKEVLITTIQVNRAIDIIT